MKLFFLSFDRSTIVQIKQKRPCQHPIQSSFPSITPSDDQRWQEQLILFPSINDDSLKSIFRLENDSRSLIGKYDKFIRIQSIEVFFSFRILNEIETNPTDHSKETNRYLFTKSLLLSLMGLRKNSRWYVFNSSRHIFFFSFK